MDNLFDVIAYIGGCILAFQMIPQIYKIIKYKSAKDISYVFLFLNMIGLLCMCTYGIHNNDKPLYITTSFSLVNTFIILIVKLYYDNRELEFNKDNNILELRL